MEVVRASVERTQEEIRNSLTALQDVSVVSLNAGSMLPAKPPTFDSRVQLTRPSRSVVS